MKSEKRFLLICSTYMRLIMTYIPKTEKEHKEFLEMSKYHLKSFGFHSILKGVPMSEENLETAKNHCTKLWGYSRSRMYVMYRGKKTGRGYCTLKKDAHSFDIYTRNVTYRRWRKK